ncbi:putative replication factor c small subunit [Tupanvirus soda lake]|uniref:Replication factor c small subunit n=2 Tax=Tupanvirus TaxID=2094720 RepID=A0AC62ABM4_9VIRU|nr:putative replication factor c small subunit [Tupanvirus soda lake]QKU35003.1 putative replication factor c small subunit [Tupanvirus soda lake]
MTENNMDSMPWIEKYRPRKLEEMTQSQNLIDLFQNSIKTGDMTHCLFYGPPGTGKTSAILAMGREIFKQYFPTRVIEFNASDDRGINAVREKITNEAKKYVTEIICEDGTRIPPYKIIILDEADSMTDEAQDALRVIIEQYSTVTRFCFICNYISKITDAIKSRCSPVYFKKLSNECMINKLNEIATKESMDLPENILDTIIDVSNGDMRKAIMLLQNLKYLYNFKKNMKKPLCQMSLTELKHIPAINSNIDEKTIITEADIYDIAASISLKEAHKIIDNILTCKNIIEISLLSKQIISRGYPIDNILMQLNKAILLTKKLDDQQKSRIISYSGRIFLKMKECANEYIQLLDYMSCVNGIKSGNSAYEFNYA